jgi:hypothetical protein
VEPRDSTIAPYGVTSGPTYVNGVNGQNNTSCLCCVLYLTSLHTMATQLQTPALRLPNNLGIRGRMLCAMPRQTQDVYAEFSQTHILSAWQGAILASLAASQCCAFNKQLWYIATVQRPNCQLQFDTLSQQLNLLLMIRKTYCVQKVP